MSVISGTFHVCRICANAPEKGGVLTPLFEMPDPAKCISKDISDLLVMLQFNFIPNDGLPQKICFNCLKTLAVICEFRNRCQDVQKILSFYHKSSHMVPFSKSVKTNTSKTNKFEAKKTNCTKMIETVQDSIIEEINTEDCYEDAAMAIGTVKIKEISKNVYKSTGSAIICDKEGLKRPARRSAIVYLKKIKTDHFDLTRMSLTNHESSRSNFDESDGGGDLEGQLRKISNCQKENIDSKLKTNHKADNLKIEIVEGELINEAIVNAADLYDGKNGVTSDEDREEFDFNGINWESPSLIDSKFTDIDNQIPKNENDNQHAIGNQGEMTIDKEQTKKLAKREKTKCPFCHQLFAKIASHLLACPVRGPTCKYCSLTFKTASEVNNHIAEMHPDGLPACSICFATFKNSHKRNEHVKIEHKKIQFVCETCGRVFLKVKMLEEHVARRHKEIINKECSKCQKILKTEFLYQRHLKQHEMEDRLKCRFCGKLLTRLQFKRNHERLHTGETPYLCEICGLGFPSGLDLSNHRKTAHGPDKERAARFKPENRRKHFDLRCRNYMPKRNEKVKFKCGFCTYEFATNYGLNHHLRKHTEVREYICKTCGNGFKRLTHLKLHEKRVHIKARDHKCQECGKTFCEKTELKNHMRLHQDHRPFHCDHCSATFKQKKNLKRHLVSHSIEKPYECGLCGLAYKCSNHLQAHLQKHSEEEIKGVEQKLLTDMAASQVSGFFEPN